MRDREVRGDKGGSYSERREVDRRVSRDRKEGVREETVRRGEGETMRRDGEKREGGSEKRGR